MLKNFFVGTPQTPPVATVAPEQSQPTQQQAQHNTPVMAQQTITSPALRTPTTDWGIEDVITFISATDPSLSIHAELFRRHVSINIDCTNLRQNSSSI